MTMLSFIKKSCFFSMFCIVYSTILAPPSLFAKICCCFQRSPSTPNLSQEFLTQPSSASNDAKTTEEVVSISNFVAESTEKFRQAPTTSPVSTPEEAELKRNFQSPTHSLRTSSANSDSDFIFIPSPKNEHNP